jgi:hypothetical protein
MGGLLGGWGQAVRVSRELAPGWREEHLVVSRAREPLIVETTVRAESRDGPPTDDLGIDLLRRVSLRGAKEAAEERLHEKTAGTFIDLRAAEGLTPARRRRGEVRRWTLALTAWAYVQVVRAGSRRANQDTAAALGITPEEVRNRLHAARRHDPRS